MWYKLPYNENFVVLAKAMQAETGYLKINFAWPYWSKVTLTTAEVGFS